MYYISAVLKTNKIMTKVIKLTKDVEQEELHPFHIFILEECGVGYYDFETVLYNLDGEQILDSIDNYVESLKINK